MMDTTLESFFQSKEVKPEVSTIPKKTNVERKELMKLFSASPTALEEMDEVYLFSATYNGEKKKAVLKLYEPKSRRIYLWDDITNHKPYCYTNLQPEELEKIPKLMAHEGLDRFEPLTRFHPLLDKSIQITKIVAKDPLSIGGRPTGCIRDIIPEARPDDKNLRVWEADIKYYENFLYDENLDVGMPYQVKKGELIPRGYTPPPGVLKQIQAVFAREPLEFKEFVDRWLTLLECPLPPLKFMALDIEVGGPDSDRVPDPSEASYPVICASTVASDGAKRVLLLKRNEPVPEKQKVSPNASMEFYDDELDLLLELMKGMINYPIVVTFNGDDFDLRYIYHRALRLGLMPDEVPLELGRETVSVTSSVHIDLYKFFFNRSIQIYAFDQKYRDVTLQDVASAIIGVGKLQLEKKLLQLSYEELAQYCLRDSELTYELASLDNLLVMKLIFAISRVGRVPLEDAARQGVSNWIRSMMYAEHRNRNYIIPTREEISAVKGLHATEAIIKGKKYRGGIVIEPKPGVKFNVAVLDFASLYPSIIKHHNLSYETILCSHPECRGNAIPETPHWACIKKRGISSLLIGSLRDLRVKWYKSKAKDETLKPEMRSWYSVVQRTLKVILNASYGVFGAEHFALYCLPMAEATAAVGRHAITSTIAKGQESGIEVVYGDTDSVFLHNPTKEQIHQLVEWSSATLGMDLDVDKNYRYVVFSTRKKNYIGVYPDGSVDIKGLTGKKRNTPAFLQAVFRKMVGILSNVMSEADFNTARNQIQTLMKDCYSKLKKKDYKIDELAFTVVLGKGLDEYDKTTPQHVKALKMMSEEQRQHIGAGSVIRYVKIKREPNVKLIQEAKIDEVDVEKYVEHIRTTFEPVAEALDIEIDQILGTSKLEGFM